MESDSKNLKKKSTISLSLKLWLSLNEKRKFQFFVYLIFLLISSFAEVLSIASVIPFLSALSDPEKIFNLPFVNSIASKFYITSPENIRIPMTLIFGIIVIICGIIRLFNLWFSYRIAASVGSDLSSEIFKKIIYRPYLEELNSGDAISLLNTEITRVVYGVIIPQLLLLSSFVICIFLITTLIIISVKATLISAFIIFSFYYYSLNITKNTLRKNSHLQVEINKKLVRTIQESFGYIREIILKQKYLYFINNFKKNNYNLNLILAKSGFINAYPRILIEPFGIVILSIIGCVIVIKSDFNSALPLIATLALGAQRIIPLMQKIYEGIVRTRSTRDSLIVVLEFLNNHNEKNYLKNAETKQNFLKKDFNVFSDLEIKDIYFKYPNDSKFLFSGVSLKINKGDCIAIIGESGSGKSTLVDLMIGLIPPSSGEILANGINIGECKGPEIANWRETISLVSQRIYLSETSIKENIAFGIERNKIDVDKINEVLKTTLLDEYISKKRFGIDTVIGENGISLSGGQQQRLGIARGIYKKPNFLILDEATSALDYKTEFEILNNLSSMNNDLTMVMITHRENNLKFCNKIFRVKNGNLIKVK
jgi:ATP-binding cassette subfamily B protein